MSQSNYTDGGKITKYDPNGNEITTTKAATIQFANTVETRQCKQTFAFKGPNESIHASRALDIVERMNKK